jgi:hypothetical protein
MDRRAGLNVAVKRTMLNAENGTPVIKPEDRHFTD